MIRLTLTVAEAQQLNDWLERAVVTLQDEVREARRDEVEVPLLVEIDSVRALQAKLEALVADQSDGGDQ